MKVLAAAVGNNMTMSSMPPIAGNIIELASTMSDYDSMVAGQEAPVTRSTTLFEDGINYVL